MLSVEEAIARLKASARLLASPETVELRAARGRVLAQDVVAPIDVPPADNSAMDGYALRHADWRGKDDVMAVSQRITAGSAPAPLTAGTVARIFTGAEVPDGADTVVMQENTLDNAVSGFSGVTTQSDARISFNGERFEVGGGIALIDLTRDIAQLVTAGTRQDVFLIDYDADITARDLSVRWRVSDRLAIGSRFYRYDNDGSFAIRQDDQRLFVDVDLSDRYLLHASLRRIESCEQVFDDYEADLLEVGLRLRW
jgi:molybdopterin molybdotransferase